nr:MAG TPA: hypothetical protein [Caudoviricetes sp.]
MKLIISLGSVILVIGVKLVILLPYITSLAKIR